jgi:2-polyprenyl-3-methyl-5-hydroxy-6-metoxy-1,4-benzoquinol methylase
MSNNHVQIQNMHFYWRVKDNANEFNPFPAFMNLKLVFDQASQILKIKTDSDYWEMMLKMYGMETNVGYLQKGHDLALPYGEEYLGFILQCISQKVKVCDIGGGSLYILQKLRYLGFDTIAVDPSTESKVSGELLNLEVISSLYEDADLSNEKIQVFIHYDVLEHVENPKAFLEKHFRELPDEGMILFAVPDCTIPVRNGDISMLLAQHVNYFEEDSLSNLVLSAGFEILQMKKSNFGGVLFCFARKIKYSNSRKTILSNRSTGHYDRFFETCSKKIKSVESFMSNAITNNENIALYIPLRVFPYISDFISYENLFFIDDSTYFQGKYFDGFNQKIMSISEAVKYVDSVVVFSPTFGERIEKKLRNEFNFAKNILSWKYR